MILIIGKTGQIARALAETAPIDQWSRSRFLDRSELDLSRPETIRDVILGFMPKAVINAAAYTAVDLAEKERELAMKVNAESPGEIAKACAELDVPLIHFSSDYVYSGAGERPWIEFDDVGPVSVYGESKARGDALIQERCRKHLILRTSWVYDDEGKNFVNTMLRLGAEREVLRVVADQIGAPTQARDIARTTWKIAARVMVDAGFKHWGICHVASQGWTSWNGFAKEIFAEAARLGIPLKVKDVQEIATSEYPTPAKRPLNSRLDTSRLKAEFGIEMPRWQDALRECLTRISKRPKG